MLFRFFSDLIDGIAPAGVLRALELQCRVLEDDIMQNRSKLTDAAWSILGFRQFIWGIRTGQPVRGILNFPSEHVEFYKKTLERLVNAGQLPPTASMHFESLLTLSINTQFAHDGFQGSRLPKQPEEQNVCD